MIRKLLLGAIAAFALSGGAVAQTPQPVWLTGLYTIAPGPDNIQDNIPAHAYCYYIAWAVDRPGGAGFMASDCGRSPPAWVTNAGPQGLTGTTGSAGVPGVDGKTVLSGVGSPAGGLGTNGDYYLDVSVTRLYGPKTSGVWGTGVSLIGATGLTGASGGVGPAGSAATIAVGAVTTGSAGSSASVTNVGTPSAAVFDIAIPRGNTGTTGSAGVNSFSSPNSRSVTQATAYQATDNTKPAVVTINLTSSASLSLSGGTTNTADVVIGSTTGVASGTGTQVCKYANTNTGALTIGLALSTVSASSCTFALPTGWYFAVRTISGVVTVTSSYDSAVG